MRGLFMDKRMKNKKVVVNSPNFKPKSNLFYEKHFKKGTLDVVEYYSDHELDTYFETEKTENFIIVRGFSSKHKLFTTDVQYLNQEGKPYMCYNEVLTNKGVLEKHYRKVNSGGQYSEEPFDSFLECLKYKSEIK